jgi:hypothetical protein
VTKLNQIVAVEKGVKTNAQRALTDAYHAIQVDGPMMGLARTYQPRTEEGEKLPDESTKVQYTVADKLDEVRSALVRLIDVTATKDYANADTTADVVVDGETLVTNAPVPFLLFLEKWLTDVRTFVSKLPVLDPAITWEPDEISNLWRSKSVVTTRTRKTPKAHVLYPATERHPAQVESFNVDEVIGDYTTTRFSGAITKGRRDELVARVDTLLRAVKFAREEANAAEVSDETVGKTVLDFLFA